METYEKELREYFLQNTGTVLKNPRGFIKYPFIDPGSVYDGNVWDWDTFWSVYGFLNLYDSQENSPVREKIIVHAKGNIFNFLDHQLEDGYIPMMIELGKWPEPYLNGKHKEGVMMNMHKPFLCNQICLISGQTGDYQWIADKTGQLEKYFDCYFRNYYFERCGLFVWCDDIMIGMDNDPASFGRPKYSTANIFLNSFMVTELRSMAEIIRNTSKEFDKADQYDAAANQLIEAIRRECWDKRDKFFYSADVDIKTRKFDWFHEGLGVFWNSLPIKIRTWSGFLPMWAGFATGEEAAAMTAHMFDPDTFASEFGITTLSRDEKMFDLSVTNNPSNWLGPIWVVANYVAFRGLMNYGYKKEAGIIAAQTAALLGKDLEETQSLHEYYDPFTGKPIMNGGFINWNILVINMMDELNGKKPLKDTFPMK